MLTVYLLSIKGVWGEQSGHLLCVVTSMLAVAVAALERERRRSLAPVIVALSPNLIWSMAIHQHHTHTSDIAGMFYLWSFIVAPGILLSSLVFWRFSKEGEELEQPRAVFFVAMLSSMTACFNALDGFARV